MSKTERARRLTKHVGLLRLNLWEPNPRPEPQKMEVLRHLGPRVTEKQTEADVSPQIKNKEIRRHRVAVYITWPWFYDISFKQIAYFGSPAMNSIEINV